PERPGCIRDVAARLIFNNQVGGVGSYDSIFSGEFRDFVAKFRVFSVQPDFIQQIPNPSRGPEAGQKFVFGTFFWEISFRGKRFVLPVYGAVSGNGRTAVA